ncbi:MAG: NRDE family protein [Burkholderiaceae bacterium]
MCLVALGLDQSRRFPLVIASNRDEFFARPTSPLAWWSPRRGAPPVLGGRDLDSGGTWLGLTAAGRLAMLTNVRGAGPADATAPSRGSIVSDWLSRAETTARFRTRTARSNYNGFNLIAADFVQGECFWATNSRAPHRRLTRGIYGLSNGTLDAPWPKVTALKRRLGTATQVATSVDDLASRLFTALGDRSIASDAALPQTGIPVERERQLSPAFILTPDGRYGTRCSTIIITERVGARSVTHVLERSFDAGGTPGSQRRVALRNWPPRSIDARFAGACEHVLAAAMAPAIAQSSQGT